MEDVIVTHAGTRLVEGKLQAAADAFSM